MHSIVLHLLLLERGLHLVEDFVDQFLVLLEFVDFGLEAVDLAELFFVFLGVMGGETHLRLPIFLQLQPPNLLFKIFILRRQRVHFPNQNVHSLFQLNKPFPLRKNRRRQPFFEIRSKMRGLILSLALSLALGGVMRDNRRAVTGILRVGVAWRNVLFPALFGGLFSLGRVFGFWGVFELGGAVFFVLFDCSDRGSAVIHIRIILLMLLHALILVPEPTLHLLLVGLLLIPGPLLRPLFLRVRLHHMRFSLFFDKRGIFERRGGD